MLRAFWMMNRAAASSAWLHYQWTIDWRSLLSLSSSFSSSSLSFSSLSRFNLLFNSHIEKSSWKRDGLHPFLHCTSFFRNWELGFTRQFKTSTLNLLWSNKYNSRSRYCCCLSWAELLVSLLLIATYVWHARLFQWIIHVLSARFSPFFPSSFSYCVNTVAMTFYFVSFLSFSYWNLVRENENSFRNWLLFLLLSTERV